MTHLHVMGIGGSGAGGFAELARSAGYEVTGCDLIGSGHDPAHLKGIDALIVSPAILAFDRRNEELSAAKEAGIPVFTWQEFLGKNLMHGSPIIGVCGSHGKTTTSAMLAYLLEEAGFDPSYLIGSSIAGGENFRTGTGPFVIEADEYWGSFLNYPVDLAVCVSLEFDHPDYFIDFPAYLEIFEKFVRRGNVLVANGGDLGVSKLLDRLGDWPGEIKEFSATYSGPLKLAGIHNQINAQAVYEAAKFLNIPDSIVKDALQEFPGVRRRLELIKKKGGKYVYSDYAHHSTQLAAAASALRRLHPNEEITIVFQPHTYSRTYALLDNFVQVLSDVPVDKVFVTDIFPSREKDTGLIKSVDVVEQVNKESVQYAPFNQVLDAVRNQKSDVVAFLGAGNIDKLASDYEAD